MKKLLLVFMLLWGVSIFASEIHWVSSYKEALSLSKKEKKPIMFIMTKSDCKYCKLLKSTTLKDKKIIKKLNKDFINYIVVTDKEGESVPYMLAVYTKGFPTIWFLDAHGQALFQPIGGYMQSKEFGSALDIVAKTYQEHLANQKKGSKK